MQRTVRIRIHPTEEQKNVLVETIAQFTCVFNNVCKIAYDAKEKNGVTIHHEVYYPQRAAHPDLVSDLHIQARMKATEAVKSALALLKKEKKVSCPNSHSCPPRFNAHTFKINWTTNKVKLSTVAGRQEFDFIFPKYAEKFRACKTATADLMHRNGHFFLHVVFHVPTRNVVPTSDVVGVDFGVCQAAVTSTNKFLGKKRWRDIEAKIFKQKRRLQIVGTDSAKRKLKKIRGKQYRFRRDCDHIVSKEIVACCPVGGTIAVENLKDIRKRVKAKKRETKRRIHSWSFAQLRSFVEYKAEEKGCTVVGVDPRHTSQGCSDCGYIARNNRRSRSWFKCRKCAFQCHADLNAGRNIAAKYQAGSSIPVTGGLHVNQPNVCGHVLHDALTSSLPLAG